MTIKELNASKTPIVRIDERLDKLAKENLFPEKLDEANNTLAATVLPPVPPLRKAKKITRNIVSPKRVQA